jgi:HPt (histidine-containing phosphotransfer) domain-containing protein
MEGEALGPSDHQGLAADPVDLAHLARYTLGDRALESEILQLFCAQSLIYLEHLHAATSEHAWREAAHSLKGSAQAVGAWRVADAALAAETGQGSDASDRTQVLAALEASVAEANGFIRSLPATHEPRDSAARD